ncbi:MAG: mechanosensitive ion channel family protein, partial [Gemmataceae bacterium]
DTVIEHVYDRLMSDAAPPPKQASPLKPADTSSPQTTVKSFVDNMNLIYRSFREKGNSTQGIDERLDFKARALRCLDLSKVAPAVLEHRGPESMVLLMEILDRTELPPYEQIPGPADVAKEKINTWTIPNTPLTIVRIDKGARQGEYVFSAETVDELPQLFERVKDMPYKQGVVLEGAYQKYLNAPGPLLPATFTEQLPDWMWARYVEQPVWKWLGTLLVLLPMLACLVLSFRFGGRLSSPATRTPFWKRAVFPLCGLLLPMLAHYLITDLVRLVGDGLDFIENALSIISYLAGAWLIMLVSRGIADLIVSSPRINARSIDAHMVRIFFRVLSLGLVVLLFLHATDDLGIPLTPVLAGLGIGGVAIALAAQNSVENLIGGVNLFVDRPVRVGDLCRFGDKLGFVEEIGLRSTRVRTLDRTMVSIPNSVFSRQEIENFAHRDRILFHPFIRLHLETTPAQMRFVLKEAGELLANHPKVDPDPARIRFVQMAECALELEIFAYIHETDYSAYLVVVEELNLAIMEIITKAGTSLAVPVRRYFANGPDPDKAQEIKSIVDSW